MRELYILFLILFTPSITGLSYSNGSPENIVVGGYIFTYKGLYRDLGIKRIFSESLRNTLALFGNECVSGWNIIYDNDRVYVNSTVYGDIVVEKYLIGRFENLSYKALLIHIRSVEAPAKPSIIFQLKHVRPRYVSLVYIIFSLSNTYMDKPDRFVRNALDPLFNTLIDLGILDPAYGLTQYLGSDPRYLDEVEKQVILARYFFLGTIYLNPDSGSEGIVYDLLYNGVNDYELALLAAHYAQYKGLDYIVVEYGFNGRRYWFTLVESHTPLSPVDRIFSDLECWGKRLYIVAGTQDNLWHWIKLSSNGVEYIRYYRLSGKRLVDVDSGVCRFRIDRPNGWILVRSLSTPGKVVIYYCSTDYHVNYIGPACLVLNHKYNIYYGYREDDRVIDDLIRSNTRGIIRGRNRFIEYLFPWIKGYAVIHREGKRVYENRTSSIEMKGDKEKLLSYNFSELINITIPHNIISALVPIAAVWVITVYIIVFLFIKPKHRSRHKLLSSKHPAYMAGEIHGSIDKRLFVDRTIELNLRERIINIFSQVIHVLSKSVEKKPWETHREYGLKIMENLGRGVHSIYHRLCILYEKARFSKRPVCKNDLDEAVSLYNKLTRSIDERFS